MKKCEEQEEEVENWGREGDRERRRIKTST
jgi:hypothetical protein